MRGRVFMVTSTGCAHILSRIRSAGLRRQSRMSASATPNGTHDIGRAPRGAATVMGADLRSARATLLGRLDLDLLDGLLLLGVQANGDGEDAVVVGRLDVVLVDVGWQRQAAGERAVPELRPVLALGLVVPLGVDRQVAGADRHLDVLLR